LFIAVLLVVTLVAVGDWVLHTSTFRVHHVEVVGATHESDGAIILASGLENQPALIDVSDSVIARRLNGFKWIKTISVVKHWPSTVRIVVTERTPVGIAYNAKKILQLVDATGRDLGIAPANTNLPLLEVTSSTALTSWPFRGAGKNAALVAGVLPPAFSEQVDQVIEGTNGNVSLKMTTPVTFALGPPTNLTAKFVAVASVIMHETLRAGDVVDVSVPDSPTITQAK
jgi:cell division protein FtsQ